MMFEVESITPGTMTLTSSSATRMAQPASATAGPCAKLRVAWANPNAGEAEAALMSLARQLDKVNPDAAASLREGLADTLTVTRLGITGTLLKKVMSTNPVESMIEIVRAHARNVKRWQDGDMRLRWAAAGMIAASSQFRRVKGHRQLPARSRSSTVTMPRSWSATTRLVPRSTTRGSPRICELPSRPAPRW